MFVVKFEYGFDAIIRVWDGEVYDELLCDI